MKKRGRKGTAVKVTGYYVERGNKKVHIKPHTRKRRKRQK